MTTTVRVFSLPRVAALLVGAAALVAGIAPSQAAIRAAVGKPLQQAQSLAASGNFSAAMAKVREAEGVGGLSGEESRVVAQMKAYVSSKSGASSDSPRGKFSIDYHAGRWSAVIADAEALRKAGQLDGTSMAAVADAYYRSGNYPGCVRYIKGNFGNGASETVLKIQMACAFQAGDDAAQTEALELLVSRSQSPEYWGQLLKAAERARGLKDPQTLDIYRLKLRTGTIAGEKEYTLLAKLALANGFPQEAQDVQQKGIDAKILSGNSSDRLMAMTKQQAGQLTAQWNAKLAQAKAAPTGDPLIKLGESIWTQQGRSKEAVDLINQGIAKDKTDMGLAQTRLGMALLADGQKEAAIKAFAKVKDNPNQVLVAKLWTLYAKK